jgi:hypothetical protein
MTATIAGAGGEASAATGAAKDIGPSSMTKRTSSSTSADWRRAEEAQAAADAAEGNGGRLVLRARIRVGALWRAMALIWGTLLVGQACSTPLTSPTISNLRLMPGSNVHPGDTLTAMVDFTDDDADVEGGALQVSLLLAGEAEGDLISTSLAGSASSNHGTIKTTVALPPSMTPGHYQMSITLIDHAQLRSNPLIVELEVAL